MNYEIELTDDADADIEKHKKSDWQIGRDYEIMVGQLFEKEGFKSTSYIKAPKKN